VTPRVPEPHTPAATATTTQTEWFEVRRHGDVVVITPTPEASEMAVGLVQQAAAALAPLTSEPLAGLVIDLSRLPFCGSAFASLLLRCRLQAKERGVPMVLAGPSAQTSQLLRLTALETLWDVYDDLDTALEALGHVD